MGISAGLVGLPNVGKSTLFNALTKSCVAAENYPFCTIDPHKAIASVPDERSKQLQAIYKSQREIPATVTFVDIAGLVKGAASGEGLGNQFLSHIREVDLILHVLRCFEDPDIIYTGTEIDPLSDFEIITAELMLKDLDSIEKRLAKVQSQMKASKSKPLELQEFTKEFNLLVAVQEAIGKADSERVRTLINHASVVTIPLLSAKKFLVIANIAESELEDEGYKNNKHYQALVQQFGTDVVIPVSAKAEYELTQLTDEEATEMMGLLGLKERGLHKIVQQSYQNLGLITFFTCGPQEIHAWPIKKGLNVRKASGEIHSDLERGFICADVFNCKDIFTLGTEVKVKEHGKMRTEGEHYIVQDGDIIHVKFNV